MGIRPNRPKYHPPPDVGWYEGQISAVEDLGIRDTQWGSRHTLRVSWQLDGVVRDDGKPFIVSKLYNNSLHEKSNLYKLVEGLLGEVPDDDTWELDSLIGTRCHFKIAHKASTKHAGQNFAIIGYIEPESPESCGSTDPGGQEETPADEPVPF